MPRDPRAFKWSLEKAACLLISQCIRVTSIHLHSLEQVSAEAKVEATSQLYAKRLYLS